MSICPVCADGLRLDPGGECRACGHYRLATLAGWLPSFLAIVIGSTMLVAVLAWLYLVAGPWLRR